MRKARAAEREVGGQGISGELVCGLGNLATLTDAGRQLATRAASCG